MQQRFYDPIAGRFLSVDPVVADAGSGKSFGRYHYASNNPYKHVDPDGRHPILAGIGVGLLLNEIATSDVPVPGAGKAKVAVNAAEKLAANAAKGKVGEAIVRNKEAGSIAGEQVTVVTSTGQRTVADFFTKVGEKLGIIEVKTGNATLTKGQAQA